MALSEKIILGDNFWGGRGGGRRGVEGEGTSGSE